MGNKALRREVGQLLKKQGLGRLYSGPKRLAFNQLPASHLKVLIFILGLKPGDLYEDCDYYNHRFAKLATPERWTHWRCSKSTVFMCEQVESETGQWSCGCPNSPCPPRTADQITQTLKGLYLDPEVEATWKAGGWWTDSCQAMKEKLLNNEPICDEQGCQLIETKINTTT